MNLEKHSLNLQLVGCGLVYTSSLIFFNVLFNLKLPTPCPRLSGITP